jgi:aspartyl-tRNA(Asn)/glutamyl-tRNA(Gln) amidotransferase subunit B
MNDVLRMVNDMAVSVADLRLTPAYLVEIIRLVDANSINISTGKALLQKVEQTHRAPGEIVQAEGLAKVSDDAPIRAIAGEVLAENPKEVAAYHAGKITLIGWFVGQVMRKMRGKADPNLTKTIFEEMLK